MIPLDINNKSVPNYSHKASTPYENIKEESIVDSNVEESFVLNEQIKNEDEIKLPYFKPCL